MLPVVNSEQMMIVERRSIDSQKVSITALMEAAGLKISEAVIDLLNGLENPNVALVCGKGNNGGDALVAARHLTANGISNKVFLISKKEAMKGDALANLEILLKTQPDSVEFVINPEDMSLNSFDIVVDAILGTGSSGELREPAKSAVKQFSNLSAKVIAVDMPTGVSSDNGSVGKDYVKADSTITMGLQKIGQQFSPGKELCGEVKIARIGFPASAMEDDSINTFIPEKIDIRRLIPELPKDSFKHKRGKVLAVGGSRGMTGAIVLSSQAALSMGCGLVITAVPASLNPIFEIKLTEEMTLPLKDESKGYFTAESSGQLLDFYEWADVMLIGPGMGGDPKTAEFIIRVAEATRIPMVIDADALTAFRERTSLLAHLGGAAVLTPHYAEFADLFECTIDMIKRDPVSIARESALKYGINIVLKGAPTVTADLDGNVYINSTGNPGMATAGSGDVLTGMIGSLIAQGLTPKDAAFAGSYLHGLAGDIASAEMGERSMKASDIIKFFPKMYESIK